MKMLSPNSPAMSKKVLMPFWSLQMFCTVGNLATYIWVACLEKDDSWINYNDPDPSKSFLFVSSIILIITNICVLGLLAHQIWRFRTDRLSARSLLNYQILLTSYASLAWIIEMLGLFEIIRGGAKTLLDFAFTASVFGLFLGMLIYSVVIHRQEKKKKIGGNAPSAYEIYPPPSYDDLTPIRKQDGVAGEYAHRSNENV